VVPKPVDRAVASLRRDLAQRTVPGVLYQRLEGGKVRCHACGHRCLIPVGHDGICKIRFNLDGVLRVPSGYVAGLAVDPIEKKPFFHAFPGAEAVSFGMLGCDFHCPYCQNWLTSQTLRDDQALAGPRNMPAAEIVALARARRAPVIVSTYNEPLITSEWAVEVFSLAKRDGIVCGYVSNGNGTPEVLDYLRPYVDLFKVDLKSYREAAYRALGGRLQVVLDTIRELRAKGFWVEVVTLVVPGFNDSREELRDIASFIAGVSEDVPWHVTAFHEDYRMGGRGDTTVEDLRRAVDAGREAGLRYVYAGNLSGHVGGLEDTRCHGCGSELIVRRGFRVLRNRLTGSGACPDCGAPIPGLWTRPA
jgi:pyruvate formate lyase activating enzyme